MEPILFIFHEGLVRPIFNVLILIYNLLPVKDFGIAIVLVTVLMRVALYPFSHKALVSQKELANLQPQIKEIQRIHKNNKEAQTKATLELYKEHKINPFVGCLPILIQFPILIALYRVFLVGLSPDTLNELYFFIHKPLDINPFFLGLVDLSKPSPALAIIAGAAQFLLSKITFVQKRDMGLPATSDGASDFQKILNQQMTYMLPVFTVFISWNFPAGLPLYWAVTTLFSFAQQYSINRKYSRAP